MARTSSNRTMLSAELLQVLDAVNGRGSSRPSSRKSSTGSFGSAKHLKDHSNIRMNTLPGFIRMTSSPFGADVNRGFSMPLYESADPTADETPYPKQRSSNTVPSRRARLEDLKKMMITRDKPKSTTWSNVTSPTNSFLKGQINSLKPVVVRASPIDIYLASINDTNKDIREVVATIKFYELTRGEIRNWLNCSPDISSVIDAYFSIIQDQNKLKLQTTEGSLRVLLGNTDISNAILGKSDSLHSSNYILRYDKAIYPVFRHHWCLLVVDVRERRVTYYDPTKRDEDLTETLIALFRFLKSEMAHHEHRNIEETTWRDFSYRTPEMLAKFSPQDSAVFICKLAEQIANGEALQVAVSSASQYRRDVVQALVSHSLNL